MPHAQGAVFNVNKYRADKRALLPAGLGVGAGSGYEQFSLCPCFGEVVAECLDPFVFAMRSRQIQAH